MAATMKSNIFLIISYLCSLSIALAQSKNQFIDHGFIDSNLIKFASTKIHPNGLLQLTNTSTRQMGQAFHAFPLPFNHNSSSSNSSKTLSFSTSFVFAIVPAGSDHPGHGLAFVISPSMDFTMALPSQYLGLFNVSNNGLPTNRILAIEFDTVETIEFQDPNDNHVGIDVNSLISVESSPASFFDNQELKNKSLNLASGDPIHVWIDYNEAEMLLNVTISPLESPRPNLPLLSRNINLSSMFLEDMYVGFTAATGTVTSDQFILGWSFSKEGKSQDFDISKLPSLPPRPITQSPPPSSSQHIKKSSSKVAIIVSSVAAIVVILLLIALGIFLFKKNKQPRGGLRRYSHTEISKATDGFNETELLGEGGSGSFYKGLLYSERIAVKKIPCGANQRRKVLEAEIDGLGKLRHKNLVHLLGYCNQKNEMLLVYEYIPNGSIDRFLFSDDRPNLSWSDRFKIIKGIGSGLLYLHEGYQNVLLHKNLKPSNVLLDEELNARVGDFGFQVSGSNPGHTAPELTETGQTSRDTDIFGFGILILEITCGRKALEPGRTPEEISLLNWVVQGFKKHELLSRKDSRLKNEVDAHEIELVLKLGLLCASHVPQDRPSMKKVMQYLDGSERLPSDERFYIHNRI